MSTLYRSKTSRRVTAAALLVLGLAGSGYLFVPESYLTAQSPTATKAPPAEALNQANTLSDAFRHSANQVLPAVVSIRNEVQPKLTKRDIRTPRGNSGNNRPGLPREFGELDPLLKRFFEQMPEMEEMQATPRMSSGSGVIVDSSGLILTNNHVIAGGGKVTVRLYDGREYVATDVRTDPATEIAVIKIKATGLPTAQLGNSDELKIGDWVLAVGQPFGLENTVTAGIVSATGRAVGITKHEEFIQTDAAINPGNSGGPLVDLKGRVIGINTAISSSSGGFQGIGFAVPVNVAKWVSSQLEKDGKVHRAYLGVGIQEVNQALADQLGLATPHGVLVTEVQPNSPAAKAGIQSQDVIVDFNGYPVVSPRNLQALAGRATIGTPQSITVIRDGKRVELKVTVQEQPANYGERTTERREETSEEPTKKEFNKFGLEVGPLTGEIGQQLGIQADAGVVITGVEEGSPADRAGLSPSMVIVQVAKKPVRNVAEFDAAIHSASPEKGVLLLVRSSEGSRFVVLKGE
jgi:serine protease Do